METSQSTSQLPERRTLTVEEAAVVLGISRTSAYEGIRRGEIPSVRVGRRLLVPRVGIDTMLGGNPEVAG